MDENKNAPAAEAPEDKKNSKSPAAPAKESKKTVEVETEKVETATAPTPAPAAQKSRPRIRKEFVVSGKFTDDVLISQLNKRDARRKSLSVLHLQRALADAGFSEAASDHGGKFGALTANATKKWQNANNYSGDFTLEQIEKMFEGDPNVNIVP